MKRDIPSMVALTDESSPRADLGHSLRIRPFRSLFLSSTVSAVGAAISIVSVNWVVYQFTRSSLDVAYLGLTGVVPGILLGFLAGVIADRYNRRNLMVLADIVRMCCIGILALVLLIFGFSLILVLAMMTLVSAFSSIFIPASQAILPSLVPKASLEDANGLLQSMDGVMYSAGSAIGGVTVAVAGVSLGLGINALTYALSALFLFQLASTAHRVISPGPAQKKSFKTDFLEGVRYMRSNLPVFQVTLAFLPANFLWALVSPFLVILAAQRFGNSSLAYSALVASLAAGTAIGAILTGRLRTGRFAGYLMGACILVQGGAATILAVSDILAISVITAAIAGLFIGVTIATFYATLQSIIPSDLLARVLSIDAVGAFGAIPAGLLVGGILIQTISISGCYLVAGIGLLLTGSVALSLKGFRSIHQAL